MKHGNVLDDLEMQWHKLCTLLIWKYEIEHAELTVADMQRFERENGTTKVLLADARGGEKIRFTIMELAEAEKLAREANLQ
jgi:hypothetical protein